jgi:hypothetical protein
MPIELLQTIKQQIIQLNAYERGEIERFLIEQRQQDQFVVATAAVSADKERKRQQRSVWLAEHREEYAGLYVALDGDRLLGTGKNYPEAAQVAKVAGVPDAYIDFVYPANYGGEMGGW